MLVEARDIFLSPKLVQVELERLPDEDLAEYGAELQEDAWRKWLTQCCIAHILLQRREGWLRELAKRWEITPTRVSEMASVWRKIVEPLAQEELALPPLAPSFFHEALRAQDPKGAILLAADAKSRDPKFSTRQFRRLVAAQEEPQEEQALTACRNCQWFQFLPQVPVKLVIQDKSYELEVELIACRHRGILGIRLESDLEFLAESCEEFWPRV